MTLKNAVKMLEEFAKIKIKYRDDMANPYNSWNTGWEPIRILAERMTNETSKEIEILELIKQEIVPNCKHPKEDRDLDPSTKMPYCTACNWDL